MATRYEAFNEITFEAYVKSAIDKAILKEQQKKTSRDKWEQSYSSLKDTVLSQLSYEDRGINHVETSCRSFRVQGLDIIVCDEEIGQAISWLMPKDREIILLYYFLQFSTREIARRIKVDPSTVRRRCRAATQKLRVFLEGPV